MCNAIVSKLMHYLVWGILYLIICTHIGSNKNNYYMLCSYGRRTSHCDTISISQWNTQNLNFINPRKIIKIQSYKVVSSKLSRSHFILPCWIYQSLTQTWCVLLIFHITEKFKDCLCYWFYVIILISTLAQNIDKEKNCWLISR